MTTILTLRLDDASQHRFEGLRKLHFPPERNLIPAHLSLFHQLPDTRLVRLALEKLEQTQERFSAEITGLRSLGRGVAFTLASGNLQQLHSRLACSFDEWLTPQDRQRFMPHIVVQNKVTGEQARGLLAVLRQEFQPTPVQACGVDLWEYLGGPWRHLRTYRFLEAGGIE